MKLGSQELHLHKMSRVQFDVNILAVIVMTARSGIPIICRWKTRGSLDLLGKEYRRTTNEIFGYNPDSGVKTLDIILILVTKSQDTILILVMTILQGRYNLTPLSYEALDHSSSFASEQCPEGFCAVAKNTLRILSLERLGESFNQQVSTMPSFHQKN